MNVSVICNIYNAERYIARFLDSLVQQDETSFETIIVNDGSTDNSVGIVKQFESKLRIQIINLPHVGLRAARAAGFDAARGEICIILDADETFASDAIGKFTEPFTDPTVGAAGGMLVGEGDNWVIKGSNLVRRLKHGIRRDGSSDAWMIPGGCLAVRRSAVLRIGGFTRRSDVAEDYDIANRLRAAGWRLVSRDDLIIYHPDPTALTAIFRRQYKVGQRVLPSLRSTFSWHALPRMLLPPGYMFALLSTAFFALMYSTLGILALGVVVVAGLAPLFRITKSPFELFYGWIVMITDFSGYTAGMMASTTRMNQRP